jgi:hypothetical protein
MELSMLLAMLAMVLSPILIWHEIFVDAPVQAARRWPGRWNMLSGMEQLALVEHLKRMSPGRRRSVTIEFLPVRESMASLAASNGIDPGFLYE